MTPSDEGARQNSSDSWYSIELGRLHSPELTARFVRLNRDEETDFFLANCEKLSNSVSLQLWHILCIPFLRIFYKQTCINGLLNRGAMFLFSSAQLGCLLGVSDKDVSTLSASGRTVLDLGAGDGHISLRFKCFFDCILATEASAFMRYRLKEKGITVIGMDEWQVNTTQVDLISCLNLLDRHPKPRTLLSQLYQKCISNNCRLLVSIVLPWEQYVEYNESGSTLAEETVHVFGETFEEQLESVIAELLTPAGFHVERFTRLPYLCEGDMHFDFYMLNSAVLLLSAA